MEENAIEDVDKIKKKIYYTIKMKKQKKDAYDDWVRKQQQEKIEMGNRSELMDKKIQEMRWKKDREEEDIKQQKWKMKRNSWNKMSWRLKKKKMTRELWKLR